MPRSKQKRIATTEFAVSLPSAWANLDSFIPNEVATIFYMKALIFHATVTHLRTWKSNTDGKIKLNNTAKIKCIPR